MDCLDSTNITVKSQLGKKISLGGDMSVGRLY